MSVQLVIDMNLSVEWVAEVRGPQVLREDVGPVVIAALRQHEAALASGALVVVDAMRSRVRVLPL